MAKVTWIMPVKNGMPYLTETLDSIARQTYRNWTILAWDNGSTDGSLDELKKQIPHRLPGKVIEGNPLGLGACLAAMVEMCATDYCARIDADDINYPERLARQMQFMESTPEIAVVGAQTVAIDESGTPCGHNIMLPLKHEDIVNRLLSQWALCHPTVLFRCKAVLSVGNYLDIQPTEDYDLWMRIAAHYRLENLEQTLLFYRVRQAGVTRSAAAAGDLDNKTAACVIRNAPTLYGCTPREAEHLLQKNKLIKLPVFYRIARHLSRTQGGSIRGRFASASFRETMRILSTPINIGVRLAWAVSEPGLRNKLKNLIQVALSTAKCGMKIILRGMSIMCCAKQLRSRCSKNNGAAQKSR